MPFHSSPLLGEVIDGKYRIDALAASGGAGTVYRATHVYLQRPAAFKVIRSDSVADPETVERFQREARVIAGLEHPNIVRVHDFGIAPVVGAYLVMEWLEGHTLRDELRRHTRLEVGPALELMGQICLAVHAAHAESLVHRDLKPDNIFLEAGPDGPTVKVLDFGVAGLQGPKAGSSTRLTDEVKVVGTPAYMSPEQWQDAALDARSDIYSLACTFFEMVTGRPPFVASSTATLMVEHLIENPPSPSLQAAEIPAFLEAALLRGLEKQAEDRFQTVEEFGRALGAVPPSVGQPSAYETRAMIVPRIMHDPVPASGSFDWTLQSAATGRVTRASPVVAPNNLPQAVTRFVGRERDTGEVKRLLSKARLLTLTGPGGCGKTRLALHLAEEVLPEYPDGVWVVELGSLMDPTLVLQAIGATLMVRAEPNRPLAQAVVEFLQPKRVLLVVDNCEHLVTACAAVISALLRACADLSVLATSQEALGLVGEAGWFVPPLSLPDLHHASSLDAILDSEAGTLFLDRAVLSNPRFALTEQNAPSVARICRRLDGIPLALELAAARVKVLSVSQIAERLDDRFRLLSVGGRTTDLRPRTLQATMDWSYDLLSEPERAAFNRLAVFAGGFTLEAAEVVCSEGAGVRDDGAGTSGLHGEWPEVSGARSGFLPPSSSFLSPGSSLLTPASPLLHEDVLEVLSHLVDKSLVQMEEHENESRYRLLETIRHYGAEKLRQSGEAPSARSRHRDFYLAIAEEAETKLSGSDQGAWLDRLELEHDNLRAALDWSRAEPAPEPLLRLAGALAKFWHVRSYEREGRAWLEGALAASGGLSAQLRATALQGAGTLAQVQGDLGGAMAHFESALAVFGELGDPRGTAGALNSLGHVAQWQGDFERATALHEQALVIARELGDAQLIAASLKHLGVDERSRGNDERAAELFRESLALFRESGDRREIANTLNNLGVIYANRGDFDHAATLLEEHLHVRRELGDKRGIAASLNNLGEVAQRRGDYARAARLFGEGLVIYRKAGDKRGIAYLLESLVTLTAAQKQPERALQLAGATMLLRESIGSPLSPAEMLELEQTLEWAREALGAERAEASLAAGRSMPPDEAIDLALKVMTATLEPLGT